MKGNVFSDESIGAVCMQWDQSKLEKRTAQWLNLADLDQHLYADNNTYLVQQHSNAAQAAP
jgi:hypothetical protein